MSGLVAFEVGVVQVGEDVGGERVVVEARVGGEGGAELVDEVAEGGAVEAQEGAGPDEEVVGVPVGDRGPGGGGAGVRVMVSGVTCQLP